MSGIKIARPFGKAVRHVFIQQLYFLCLFRYSSGVQSMFFLKTL